MDAATQFDVDDGLGTIADAGDHPEQFPQGTIADAGHHHLHGMQQVDHVSAAVEAAVGETMRGMAVASENSFVETVRLAVMAHPRVQEAIEAVEDIAAEVTPQEIDRLRRP